MNEINYLYDCALIVDDDATDIYINKRILEITRFAKNIVVKKSCAEALQYLSDESTRMGIKNIPDVVFLDYFMPILGGKEFLERFKDLPASVTEKSKVIMLSVLDESFQPAHYDRQFVSNAISKPLTQEKLQEVFTPVVSLEKIV